MMYDGNRNVVAAGVRVALMPVSTRACLVIIQSMTANQGAIYVGGATVSATSGIELPAALDNVTLPPVADLNTYDLVNIFIDAVNPGEGVKFLYQRR